MSRGGSARQRRRNRRAADRAALGVGKAQDNTAVTASGSEVALDEDVDLSTFAEQLEQLGYTLETQEEPVLVEFGVQGGSYSLGDRAEAWDGSAAEKSYDLPADADCFMWSEDGGDRSVKGTFKFPFVDKDDGGKHAVWKAITAIAGVLSGARGGSSIPAADVPKLKTKVEGYYAKAREKYNDPEIKAPWEGESSASVEETIYQLAYAECGDIPDVLNAAVDEWAPRFGYTVEALEEDGVRVGGIFAKTVPSSPYTGKCSQEGCGHMAAAHGGKMNDGSCSMQSCDCAGFLPANQDHANGDVGAEFAPVHDGDAPTEKDERGAADDETDPADKMTGTCDCGHSSMAHAGDMNAGECMSENCDCGGFSKKGASSETASLDRTYFTLTSNTSNVTATSGTQPYTITLSNFVLTWPDGSAGTFDVNAGIDLPAEHLPQSTIPSPSDAIRPALETPLPTGAVQWTAVLAPEGHATDDGRIFAPGSITWRELPLTLMGMVKTAEGHDGAEVCGRIDRVWRDEASGLVMGAGEFDTGEFGAEIARLVHDGTLRGVSVDIAVSDMEIVPRSQVVDENGDWIAQPEEAAEEDREEPSLLDILFGGDGEDMIFVVRKGVIGAATVCPFPAFAEANIEIAASLVASVKAPNVWTVTGDAGWRLRALRGPGKPQDASEDPDGNTEPSLTASAVGIAPVAPPAEWFDDPQLEQLTALTVDDDGRVFGHAAAWDTCHIGIPGVCTTAPHSNADYAFFLLKEVLCEDGSRVPVGTITLDTGHAGREMSRLEATRHYDDTGTAVADVIVGEDEFGIWLSGALRGDVDADQARKLRGASLSGDWRSVNGNLELVGLLAVNVPGFPVPRTNAALCASGDSFMVSALIAAGMHNGEAVAHTDVRYMTEEEEQGFALLALQTLEEEA